jgi:hypothetical protein
VVFLNAPENVFNPDYNPFLATWVIKESTSNAFPQIVIRKDDLNLVWLEPYHPCVEQTCYLGKFRAELTGNTLTSSGFSDMLSFNMNSTLLSGDLRVHVYTKI